MLDPNNFGAFATRGSRRTQRPQLGVYAAWTVPGDADGPAEGADSTELGMNEKVVSARWVSTPVSRLIGSKVTFQVLSAHGPDVTWAWTSRFVAEIR
jgi:hypothetical protein